MPNFSLNCDIDQGFNFRKERSTPVGYITEMTVGGKKLKADTTCKDPTNTAASLKVVGVVSDVSWGVGATDSIYFACQISADNRQEVQMLAYLELTSVEVTFKFRVYNYDPVVKKYYLCFHAEDAEMKGLLEKHGDDLNVSVSDDPSREVQSPINYAFRIGIKPQQLSQSITLATADQKNVAKPWGLNVR